MYRSNSSRYGLVAILIHWISALLIIGLFAAGLIAANTANIEDKLILLRIHVPLGMFVMLLTLARLAWWSLADKKPASLATNLAWQNSAAKVVHRLLYAVTIGMALSGVAMLAMSGAGDLLFGNSTKDLPDFWDFGPRFGHWVMAWLLLALLIMHVAAAFYHQFVLRDNLMARMGVRK